jgi:hypothetical protein
VIVAEDWMCPTPNPFADDRRLLKAALLYADMVDVRRISYSFVFMRAICEFYEERGRPSILDPVAIARKLGITEVHSVLSRLAGYPSVNELPPETAARADAALDELRSAAAAGALVIPPPGSKAEADWWRPMADPSQVPFLKRPPTHSWPRTTEAVHPRAWEAALTARLLGELEAFPDASMDVILDVRERLKGPRTYFRAAMSKAAQELSQTDFSDDSLDAAATRLRVETVAPALQTIRETLDGLGVRRTLLRLAKNKFTATSVGATVTMAAGGGGVAGLRQLAQGLIAGPLLAAAATEADHRREVKDELHARPFWLLHETESNLRRSTKASHHRGP